MKRWLNRALRRTGDRLFPVAGELARWHGNGNRIFAVDGGESRRPATATDMRRWRAQGLRLSFEAGSRDNVVAIGAIQTSLQLQVRFEAASGSSLVIASGCDFSSSSLLIQHGSDARVSFGPDSGIHGIDAIVKGGTTVSIGSGCLIARGVTIRTGDAHEVVDRVTGQIVNHQRNPLRIGDRCWICRDARILKNADIADDMIVGEAAVVGGKFQEPFCVLAGNPARVVKKNVAWRR